MLLERAMIQFPLVVVGTPPYVSSSEQQRLFETCDVARDEPTNTSGNSHLDGSFASTIYDTNNISTCSYYLLSMHTNNIINA